MTVVITEKAFTEAMVAAVSERGRDYVYPNELKGNEPGAELVGLYCLYFDLNDPSKPLCLIGVAVSKCGVTMDDIKRLNQSWPNTQNMTAAVLLRLHNASKKVIDAASSAQFVQDNGGTWGEALDKYFEVLGSHPDES